MGDDEVQFIRVGFSPGLRDRFRRSEIALTCPLVVQFSQNLSSRSLSINLDTTRPTTTTPSLIRKPLQITKQPLPTLRIRTPQRLELVPLQQLVPALRHRHSNKQRRIREIRAVEDMVGGRDLEEAV